MVCLDVARIVYMIFRNNILRVQIGLPSSFKSKYLQHEKKINFFVFVRLKMLIFLFKTQN